jgi:anaerobic magnesium-protoporphyrin IX monomethyl ester cyclase
MVKNLETLINKKTKLLLIEAGSELEAGIPPNVAILVSAVRSSGYDVEVFSTNDYRHSETTGDEVRVGTLQVPPINQKDIIYAPKSTDMISDFKIVVGRFKPDIIGISATEATYLLGLDLLKSVNNPNITKIVGGAHSTLNPHDVINEKCVDAICVGEGEEALVELCNSIEEGKIDYGIKNLWFKLDSRIVRNELRPLVNIDNIPFQDWSPWEIPPRASKPMAGKIRQTALIELSRGCPFNCSYCANSFLNKEFKGNYRERSVDSFIDEVKLLRDKWGVEFIYVADETILTTKKSRFNEFVKKYAKVKLPFWCETRPESITYERIRDLLDVGLLSINVGLESGNQEFRKKILNRNVKDEKIIYGIQEAVRAGAKVGANIIIGFPGETRENIFETIELVKKAKPTSTMVHLFQPYGQTALRTECIKMGLIPMDYICGDYRKDAIGTGEISAEELRGLQRTFNLYIDLPKERWDEIKLAEYYTDEGNKKFCELGREYQLKYFGKTNF